MISESGASGQNVTYESVVAPPRAAVQTGVSTYSSPAEGAKAGGDWCEVITLSDSLVVLTVGDVSGHGMSVAPTMAVMRRSVLRACQEGQSPSNVLSIANGVAGNVGDGILVTAIVALVDQRRRTLTFANAGHPPPLLLTSNEHAFLAHPPADLPLGVFPHLIAAAYVVAFPADALLVLYTDGITEHKPTRSPVKRTCSKPRALRTSDRSETRPHHRGASVLERPWERRCRDARLRAGPQPPTA